MPTNVKRPPKISAHYITLLKTPLERGVKMVEEQVTLIPSGPWNSARLFQIILSTCEINGRLEKRAATVL